MNRTRAFAGLAGLLGLGALAAGLADALPESARAAGALVLVLALPAFLLRGLAPPVADTARRDGALGVSVAFLAWLGALALWTTLFTAAHASFRVYAVATVWALMAFYAGAAIHAWRRSATTGATARRAWWLIVGACVLFAALNPPRMTVGEDSLDHVGYVRRVLTENSLEPAGVLAPPAGETSAWHDPRKGALHPVLAFSSWVASTDPEVAWRRLSLILFPAAALSLLAFNHAFIASRGGRIAAAALILLTFDGNPFRFVSASANGESIAAMWAWVLGAVVVAAPSQRLRPWHWILLATGGVLVHLGVAWHVLVLVATIAALGHAWGIPPRERLARCAWLATGVALGLALRRDDLFGATNVIHAHTQGVMMVSKDLFVSSPMETLRLHGLIFLGGLVCVPLLAISRRADARRVLAAAAIPFAVSFVPWIATWLHAHASYMVFRSLLQVPAFAAIALAGSVLVAGVRARTSQRFVAVYQQHGNPRDPYALERIRAVRDVLSPFYVPEAAAAACRRFAVNYVVLNGLPPAGAPDLLEVWDARMYRSARARVRSMAPAFALVDSTAHAAVYRFDPDAALGRGWSPRDQPVVTASLPLSPCEVEAPGGAFRVTGIALDRARVLPGDTLRVTLGYYRDAPLPFSLPSVMHLRFDHDEVGSARVFPGEKQWRRMMDRRSGVTSRFRCDLRPGHGVYEPDLWPTGFDLRETFVVVVPTNTRHGEYAVELSIEGETVVPNFHVRDLVFNRDHYSGRRCASLEVVDRITGAEGTP